MSLYDPDATYVITVEGRPGRWDDGSVVGELAGCRLILDTSEPCPEAYDCFEDWCDWCQANEEPPGAGADPYGRTAEDWARHAE